MVAIKDMEMPSDCATCRFCVKRKSTDYGYYQDERKTPSFSYGDISDRSQ